MQHFTKIISVNWISVTRLHNVLVLVADNPAGTEAEDLSHDNVLSHCTS